MKVYLVQHAAALSKDKDPERPLSAHGRADAKRVGEFVAGAGIRVASVTHSGKKRAAETAEILATALGAESTLRKTDGLAPNDPVACFAESLGHEAGDKLIVGHLPFMARLASYLAVNDEERLRVAFIPGSLVCLERDEGGAWSLKWMIRPELLHTASVFADEQGLDAHEA